MKIIHQHDQFLQDIQPVEQPLTHGQLDGLGDYWSGTVDINGIPKLVEGASWGQIDDQQYVYRYVFTTPSGRRIDDILDPFAREYGYGDIAAISVGHQPFQFDQAVEAGFKVPNIKDAIVYELNIEELGGDLTKTLGLLDYLADLGVNVIEVMPVCNTAARIDWGYDPLGYFGVASRIGRQEEFQHFVQEAHRRGLAVVLDSVYGHVEDRFPYASLYNALGKTSPFVGPFAEDQFFQSTDFSKSLAQDHFFTANVFWLETFHVDAFRYDDVPEYWDQTRAIGQQGYSDLVDATRSHVVAQAGVGDYARFFPAGGGEVTLLQIAEFLGVGSSKFLPFPTNPPQHVLFDTVSNSTWQNGTMEAAKSCARGETGALSAFGSALGLQDYPTSSPQQGTRITKSALQYIETHDHERFICTFGTHFPDKHSQDPLLLVGDRDTKWFKVQPYLIGLLTAKGTPLLWQGQEICQDYFVPDNGSGRVAIYRPVDFNYFYDPIGRALIRLVRKLTRIRQGGAQFRGGDHFFYTDDRFVSRGLLLFHRSMGPTFSLVALNFTDGDQPVSFNFPVAGDYVEQVEGPQNLPGVQANVPTAITVPSNYGCIWTVH